MELIDREALGVGKCNPSVFENPEYAKGWNNLIDIICNAPTIDAVEVVHGEWIPCDTKYPDDDMNCSVCGETSSEHGNYCPDCGAKMGKRRESEAG